MTGRTGDALALAALALSLAALPARGEEAVAVDASVDRTELRLDEALVLTLRVEADEAPTSIDLREGSLPFTVRSRSESRSASVSVGGGAGLRVRRTLVVTLALEPTRAGELEIPPLGVVVDGRRHVTAPIRVRVLPAAGPRANAPPPAPPPAPRGGTWRGWERDLVLEVEVDRREVFLGEQVTASVWLLSPAGVVDYEAFRKPLLDGFWVEVLEEPRDIRYELRDVDGVPTRAYLVQRVALFPTRAGDLEIGPYALDLALRVGSPSLFSPRAGVARAHRESAPVRLRVKPLPPGAPPGFEAVNVGRFEVEATISAPAIAAGEPVGVSVTASGEGNVRALALPAPPAVAGARRFEPTASEEVAVRGSRFGGSRTVETVFVPEGPGELSIPPLAVSFFDPRARRYVTARTAPLRVSVAPGRAAPGPAAPADPLAGLRPPRPPGALAPRASPPPWRSPIFLAAVALPPLGFALLAGRDRWRRRAAAAEPARRARRAGGLAGRRLRAAAERLAAGDRARFLDETGRALSGYAADRLGRPVAALTREAIAAALADAGASPAAAAALSRALEASDAARFGAGAAREEEVRDLAFAALAMLEEGGTPTRGGGDPS